ncbi:MAG: HmuY family protein [Polyangiales bacterium]
MKLRTIALLCTGLACSSAGGSTPQGDASVAADVAPDSAADASPDVSPDVAPDAAPAARCMATTVQCQDESIQRLGLFDRVNTVATIRQESAEGGVFVHNVDATGGGMTPTRAYVYARFTDEGLVKVDLSDEDAFTSLDWDVAFRRFIIRVNSGVSGPSCVDAARTAPRTDFDALTAVPPGLTYRTEEYVTPPSCEIVPDGSGLGSPSTALSSFWTYSGCVHMSGNVYVIRLRSGRSVKFKVLSYYSPAAQEQCNTSDSLPSPSGAGFLRVQWAFLGS